MPRPTIADQRSTIVLAGHTNALTCRLPRIGQVLHYLTREATCEVYATDRGLTVVGEDGSEFGPYAEPAEARARMMKALDSED